MYVILSRTNAPSPVALFSQPFLSLDSLELLIIEDAGGMLNATVRGI